MSWTDRLSDIKFEIKTGDGKTYYPLWVSSEKSKDFNVSRFDFINLEGSLVDRKKPQGSTYPLVFMFQGEDNIEQAEAFETSSNDNRMWVIQHPFYGTIKGQPANLKRNDNNYNTTEISIDFWESILGDFPEEAISIVDSVDDKALKVKTISIGLFVENAEPTTADIDTLKTNVTLSSSKFSPDSGSYNSFNNSKKTALKATDSLVTKTENSFTTINKIYDEPSSFNVPVLKKVKSYIEAYKVVKFLIKNRFSKYNFESQSAYIFFRNLQKLCQSSRRRLHN
ncbi:hypothetical protein CHPG_00003 [Cellulophaga phage phi3:1]|nr:hypothetical protein CHPG_00003 [Cellulophaga phage phi3:1]